MNIKTLGIDIAIENTQRYREVLRGHYKYAAI
jgi:hypothetical protein